MLKKIKEAVRKETLGYTEKKKRRLLVRFMAGFALLIAMNFGINCMKLFRANKGAPKQEIQVQTKVEHTDSSKPVSHEQMMNSLQNLKTDIQKQRKNHEQHER